MSRARRVKKKRKSERAFWRGQVATYWRLVWRNQRGDFFRAPRLDPVS